MNTPSLKELLAQKAELDRRIAETQRAEREQALAQVRTLMAEYGLTMADVAGHGRAASAPRGKPGGSVAPKYRDPATGQTWSGRGLQPRWLREALAAGRPIAEFAI
jgi:DNA-binding protein H-NS